MTVIPEDFAVSARPTGDLVLICPDCSWELTIDPFDQKADTLGSLLGEAVDHTGERHSDVLAEDIPCKP